MFTQENISIPGISSTEPSSYIELPVYLPPCSCREYAQQFRTYAHQKTMMTRYSNQIEDEDAAKICGKLVQSIEESRKYVQQQLAIHGERITKKWKDKTVKNRAAILEIIDPNMYEKKWPEPWIQHDCRHTGEWWTTSREQRFRNIYLLPYISVENLKENPTRLTNLLNLRAKFEPWEFVPFDSRQLQFPWTAGLLQTSYNQNCIVMQGQGYGKLVPWDEKATHRGDMSGFPRGQLILEAQSCLMSFCEKIVKSLVEGISQNGQSSTLNSIPKTPHVQRVSSFADEGFTVSPNFDLQKLSMICKTRLDMAGDHLAQLQTDPVYMRRNIKLILEADYHLKVPEEKMYGMCASDIDYDGWTVRHWDWLSEEVAELTVLRIKFAEQVCSGQAVPREYEEKLASLEALILQLLDIQSRHIQSVVPHRPGFIHLYDITYTPKDNGMLTRIHARDRDFSIVRQSELFLKDPLTWCFHLLTTNPDADVTYDHMRYFEFLDQYLNKASEEERSRIDETLYRKVSDLAALNEMLVMLRAHRPRAAQWDIQRPNASEQSRAWRFMSKKMSKKECNEEGMHERMRNLQEVSVGLQDLGLALKAFMEEEQVQEDGSDSSWMRADIKQRKKLSAFWNTMRLIHYAKLKSNKLYFEEIKADMKLLQAEDEPEFKAALQAEREGFLRRSSDATTEKDEKRSTKIKANKTRVGFEGGLVEPVASASVKNHTRAVKGKPEELATEIQTQWGSTPESSKPSGMVKNKPKTRGQGRSVEQDLEALEIDDAFEENRNVPKVAIKKSAFNVFTNLFPGRRSGSNLIPWTSFVDAMAKVGFVSHHIDGSAVTFEPIEISKWYGQRSIAFHRPHPVAKLDKVRMRSIGYRMNKWFGWNKETFVLDH